jgi:ATP-dependent DNA ligase
MGSGKICGWWPFWLSSVAFLTARRYARKVLSPSQAPSFPVGFIEPCLPTVSHTPPSGPLWVHEIKHDGFRFICRRDGERVRVFSRRGRDWTDRVPLITEALLALPVKSVVVDGEGAVCDDRGGYGSRPARRLASKRAPYRVR